MKWFTDMDDEAKVISLIAVLFFLLLTVSTITDLVKSLYLNGVNP